MSNIEEREIKFLRLIRVLKTEELTVSAIKQHRDSVEQEFKMLYDPEEVVDKMILYDNSVSKYISDEFIDSIKGFVVEAYSKRFSSEEADELLEILSRPAYQKFIGLYFDIIKETTEKTLNLLEKNINESEKDLPF